MNYYKIIKLDNYPWFIDYYKIMHLDKSFQAFEPMPPNLVRYRLITQCVVTSQPSDLIMYMFCSFTHLK